MPKRYAKYMMLSCVLLWGCPGTSGNPKPDDAVTAQACVVDRADAWTVAQQWATTTKAQDLPEAASAVMASWPTSPQLMRVWRAEDGLIYALVGQDSEQAKGQALMLELGAAAPFKVNHVSVAMATQLWPSLE